MGRPVGRVAVSFLAMIATVPARVPEVVRVSLVGSGLAREVGDRTVATEKGKAALNALRHELRVRLWRDGRDLYRAWREDRLEVLGPDEIAIKEPRRDE